MCGRFALSMLPELFQELFAVEAPWGYGPRWNIAPDSEIAIVRAPPGQERSAALARWGILAPWMKDAKDPQRQINARAETAGQKPTFRAAFAKGRCLIPADGFYEWQKPASGPSRPFFIGRADRTPMAFAGLWRRNRLATGELQDSCAILTMAAHPGIHAIHHRMPVMLAPSRWNDWLDPAFEQPEIVAQILEPIAERDLAWWPVGRAVGNPRNDGPELTLPVTDAAPPPPKIQDSLL